MKTIHRQANRHIYDMQTKDYTTISELREFVKQGGEIKVLDHNKKDVTKEVLFNIIKEGQELRPLAGAKTLHSIIRDYDSLSDFIVKSFKSK